MSPLYGKSNLSSTNEQKKSTKIFRSAGESTTSQWTPGITVVQKQTVNSKVCSTSHFLLRLTV
ncbi:hypothetical protein CI104_04700 [Citrobacter farmeri]|uniref:Uncharacterized protein n=1 Tax=Citrobacter farmeri TaxID=67824 RepID=A0ACA8DDI3_9ENTR|nr:hypothetical protein CI104_04700 [Citrobacter farmeri]